MTVASASKVVLPEKPFLDKALENMPITKWVIGKDEEPSLKKTAKYVVIFFTFILPPILLAIFLDLCNNFYAKALEYFNPTAPLAAKKEVNPPPKANTVKEAEGSVFEHKEEYHIEKIEEPEETVVTAEEPECATPALPAPAQPKKPVSWLNQLFGY